MRSFPTNRMIEYRYNGYGRLTQLIARNGATGDQVTEWEYGMTEYCYKTDARLTQLIARSEVAEIGGTRMR